LAIWACPGLLPLPWCSAGSSKSGERKPGKLTLAAYPCIVNLWHPSRNGGMSPGDHMHGSKKRVWLQCHGCPACGEVHEWNTQAQDLTRQGGDIVCPACESRTSFCSCRSVAANERLAADWHEENPSPTGVAVGNNNQYRWRCSDALCGHVWATSQNLRSTNGSNCPECARKGNGKIKHASLADGRPDLVFEWDEDRNGCKATGVTCGSDKKAWWVCGRYGGSWQAKVINRANRGYGCPSCREAFSGKGQDVR